MKNKNYIPESLKELKRQASCRKFNISAIANTPVTKRASLLPELARSQPFTTSGVGKGKRELPCLSQIDLDNTRALEVKGKQVASNRPLLQRRQSVQDMSEAARRRSTQLRRQQSFIDFGAPSRRRRSTSVDSAALHGTMGLSLSASDHKSRRSIRTHSARRRSSVQGSRTEEARSDESPNNLSSSSDARKSSQDGARYRRLSSTGGSCSQLKDTKSPFKHRVRRSLRGRCFPLQRDYSSRNLPLLLTGENDHCQPENPNDDEVSIDDTAANSRSPRTTSRYGELERIHRSPNPRYSRSNVIAESNRNRNRVGASPSQGRSPRHLEASPGRRLPQRRHSRADDDRCLNRSTNFARTKLTRCRSADASAFCTPRRLRSEMPFRGKVEASTNDLPIISVDDDISIDDSVNYMEPQEKGKEPNLVNEYNTSTQGARPRLRRSKSSVEDSVLLEISSDHLHRTPKKKLPPRSKTVGSSVIGTLKNMATPIKSLSTISPYPKTSKRSNGTEDPDSKPGDGDLAAVFEPKSPSAFPKPLGSKPRGRSGGSRPHNPTPATDGKMCKVKTRPSRTNSGSKEKKPKRKPTENRKPDERSIRQPIRRVKSKGSSRSRSGSRSSLSARRHSEALSLSPHQKAMEVPPLEISIENLGEDTKSMSVSPKQDHRTPTGSPAPCVAYNRQSTVVWQCQCGQECSKGSEFCASCGAKQRWTCSSCNEDSNLCIFAFCAMCGQQRARSSELEPKEPRRAAAPESPLSVIMSTSVK